MIHTWQRVQHLKSDSQAGTATVEVAITLSALMASVVFVLSLVSVGLTRAQLQESARQGARLASVGSSEFVLTPQQRAKGMTVTTSTEGPWVTVTAKASVKVLGLKVANLRLSESATAFLEQRIAEE